MSVLQLLRILWAHRWVELAILLLALASAVMLTAVLPKKYTATASVFLDVRSPDPIAGIVLPGVSTSGYISTQVDILKGERVARSVASSLSLDQRPYIREKWINETDEKIEFNLWATEYLQKNLAVKPGRESSVINVTFTGPSATFAAEAANAFVQAYLASVLELKLEPARLYASWFEDQTRAVRERLEAAQRAMSNYEQQAGILSPDDRFDFESSTLGDLTRQLTEVQAAIAVSENKHKALRTNFVAETMDSDVIKALKIDISRVNARLKEAGVNLTDDHPTVMRAREELEALKSQLKDETKLIATSIETSYVLGKQRERDLQRAISEQKEKVLALNRQRNQLNVYKRDLESAQRTFETVSERAAQSRLESLNNQTNVVSLSAAQPPLRPSQPKVLFTLLVAACLGGMAALAAALLLEMLNRRVRSEEDLAIIDVPLLASMSPAQVGSRRRARLFWNSSPALGRRKAAISG